MNEAGGTGSGRVAEGGCMCGAVRVRANGKPMGVVYCHCHDCRASSGAPVSLFAGYRAEQVEWSRGKPKGYRSSETVVRSFCPHCGTPLSYKDGGLPGEVYVPIGVFDAPEAFEPEVHDWASQRIPWFEVHDDLPRYEESSIPR